MKNPNLSFALPAFALALAMYAVPIAPAQDAAMHGSKHGKMSVTGCLQKGDEAGEYSITGQDGKMYGLSSTSVDLSKHVGHKVTVMGMMKPESAENEKAEANTNTNKEGAEAGDITVSKLKMISTTCP